MKVNPGKWLLFFLCLTAGAMLLVSCEGGGDDDDDPAVVTNTVVVTNSPPPPSPQSLKAGTTAIGAGALFNSGNFTVPEAGQVVAMATWGEAVQLTAYMKKSGDAGNLGWVQGMSPLTSTADGMAKDDVMTFYIYNDSATDVTVDYTVTYNPP